MDTFDLRKFLTESKLTANSRLISENIDQLKATIKAAIQSGDTEDGIPPTKFESELEHYKGQDVNIEYQADRDGSYTVFRYLEDYDNAEEFEESAKKYNDDLVGYVRNGVFNPLQEMEAPMEGDYSEGNHMEGETIEEVVAEYVIEALKGKDIKEVTRIIEARCNRAAMELKMETIAEVINAYEGRLSEVKGSQYFKEMADESKVVAQEGMIKGLHEMAIDVKEKYKETYMKKEKAPKKKK